MDDKSGRTLQTRRAYPNSIPKYNLSSVIDLSVCMDFLDYLNLVCQEDASFIGVNLHKPDSHMKSPLLCFTLQTSLHQLTQHFLKMYFFYAISVYDVTKIYNDLLDVLQQTFDDTLN